MKKKTYMLYIRQKVVTIHNVQKCNLFLDNNDVCSASNDDAGDETEQLLLTIPKRVTQK